MIVLAISSGGGHWIELLRLQSAFIGHSVEFATVQDEYRTDVPGAPFHLITDATSWNPLKVALLAIEVLILVLRVKPQVIVSTGAAPGYFALRFGKWVGARTVWLDSLANVESLSKAGSMVKPYADLWLTQWPELSRPTGPSYAGTVI